MKPNQLFAAVATLALGLCATAIAQDHRGGRPGGPPEGPPDGPPEAGANAVAHLTELYAMLAPFDTNEDNQLDATETAALAAAITAGTLKGPPPPVHPDGFQPKPEMIAHHLAEMYATLAPYDADQNGVLDATEQAALKAAIDSGKLPRPGGPPH